jgi:hypothetical protein
VSRVATHPQFWLGVALIAAGVLIAAIALRAYAQHDCNKPAEQQHPPCCDLNELREDLEDLQLGARAVINGWDRRVINHPEMNRLIEHLNFTLNDTQQQP